MKIKAINCKLNSRLKFYMKFKNRTNMSPYIILTHGAKQHFLTVPEKYIVWKTFTKANLLDCRPGQSKQVKKREFKKNMKHETQAFNRKAKNMKRGQ